jgi:NitT/TauT family transport system permease protein
MTERSNTIKSVALQAAVVSALVGIWSIVWASGLFHESALPSPLAVLRAFGMELRTSRLPNDLVVSLFRVSCGFSIAVVLGIPTGLWLGHGLVARKTLLPLINFFRNLSPLAWMPFAILWFGVGDAATIFLIFLAAYFPIALATMAAVGSIPAVHFRVARAYGLSGVEKLTKVTLPAIMPQVITTLRVTAGLAWLIVVAAEMVAGRDGLGFAVMDSRNGLRTDLLIVQMIAIGLIGVAMDRVLMRLTRIPSVQWGYQR